MSTRPGLLARLKSLLRPTSGRSDAALTSAPPLGLPTATATVSIAPPRPKDLRITYAPSMDGDPDAGEIVWTWVPYAENDGRGKDRPVLVIGRMDDSHVYAVRLTSRSHDGDRDFLAIGAGPWDVQRRPSWIDIEQLYSVHESGLRREACALDRERFATVADALHRRYGWAVDG